MHIVAIGGSLAHRTYADLEAAGMRLRLLLTSHLSRRFRAAAVPAAGLLAVAAGLAACSASPAPAQAGRHGDRSRGHAGPAHRSRVDVRRAVLHQGLRRLPAVTPRRDDQLRLGRQQRGITRFTAGQADFGATDVPASAADLAGARGGPAIQVPVDLGAVAVSYDVQARGNTPLKLTGPVLAKIFLGQITKWTDPAITALNPSAGLPDVYINVVHRSDGSGTTYIFSNYLSSVSPAWASAVGAGRSLHWPVGYGASGDPGVAAAIEHAADSIGYLETSYSEGIGRRVRRYRQPGRELRHPDCHRDRRRRRGQAADHRQRLLHRQPARPRRLPDLRLQLGPDLRQAANQRRRPGSHRPRHQLARP